ncbi:hypothetical protein F3Y22_tig00110450pilonHSYRG00906 [Hibiscus syriacus]|uniref:Rx N-terminal domain-containing protein n=1 Tax=Hibiscus syriacus TaxID=106335 RepID=A0A6A3AKP0_HIBSY|nr:hypothetical protein F3Y22_tig00110450pilonHSYRG00906 [Hibiscus syriacus]
MADAVVLLAVERISDLLINEALFLKDVKEQVESLKDDLKRMQCFLKDAECKSEQGERFRNQESEIRGLAYDAEDVIDSFILKLAHIGAFGIPGDGVGSSCVTSMQQRLRRTFLHVEEEDVISFEVSTKDVLAQLMTEEDGCMGDIGKTTLARKVYKHVDVKRHFDFLAWVSISQQCNPREVLQDVLLKVQPGGESIDKLNKNQKAFPRNKTGPHVCSRAFEKLGREMVKTCGRLPLAIVVFHYPEDWEISKKELIRLWIDEGFISPSLESKDTLMEDLSEQFLEDLMNRSLVQVARRDYTGINTPLNESDVILAEPMLRRIAIQPNKRHKFQNFKGVDCYDSECSELLVSSEIGNLHHLRNLKLYGIEIILPQAIGRLKSLHTLYLKYHRYVTIPNVVFMVERLRHIVLRSSDRIGDNMCLHPSKTVVGLSNLRSLGMGFKRAADVKPILMSLHLMQFKRGSTQSYPDLEPLSQCHRLSELEIRGELKEDPQGSHQWSNGCFGEATLFEDSSLNYRAYGGRKIICSADGFPQLHSLEMFYLQELEEWEIEEGAMPHLRSLCLKEISNLKMIPEG